MFAYKLRPHVGTHNVTSTASSNPKPRSNDQGGPIEQSIREDLTTFERLYLEHLQSQSQSQLADNSSKIESQSQSQSSFANFIQFLNTHKFLSYFPLMKTTGGIIPSYCNEDGFYQLLYSVCLHRMADRIFGQKFNAVCYYVFMLYVLYENVLNNDNVEDVRHRVKRARRSSSRSGGGSDGVSDSFLKEAGDIGDDNDGLYPWMELLLPVGIRYDHGWSSRLLVKQKRSFRAPIRISMAQYSIVQRLKDWSLERMARCKEDRGGVRCTFGGAGSCKRDCVRARDVVEVIDRLIYQECFELCEYSGPGTLEGYAGNDPAIISRTKLVAKMAFPQQQQAIPPSFWMPSTETSFNKNTFANDLKKLRLHMDQYYAEWKVLDHTIVHEESTSSYFINRKGATKSANMSKIFRKKIEIMRRKLSAVKTLIIKSSTDYYGSEKSKLRCETRLSHLNSMIQGDNSNRPRNLQFSSQCKHEREDTIQKILLTKKSCRDEISMQEKRLKRRFGRVSQLNIDLDEHSDNKCKAHTIDITRKGSNMRIGEEDTIVREEKVRERDNTKLPFNKIDISASVSSEERITIHTALLPLLTSVLKQQSDDINERSNEVTNNITTSAEMQEKIDSSVEGNIDITKSRSEDAGESNSYDGEHGGPKGNDTFEDNKKPLHSLLTTNGIALKLPSEQAPLQKHSNHKHPVGAPRCHQKRLPSSLDQRKALSIVNSSLKKKRNQDDNAVMYTKSNCNQWDDEWNEENTCSHNSEISDVDEMSLFSSAVGAGGAALKSLLNQVSQSNNDDQRQHDIYDIHSPSLSLGRKSLNNLIQQVIDQSSGTRSQKRIGSTNKIQKCQGKERCEKPFSRKRDFNLDEDDNGLTKLLNQSTLDDVMDSIELEEEDEKDRIRYPEPEALRCRQNSDQRKTSSVAGKLRKQKRKKYDNAVFGSKSYCDHGDEELDEENSYNYSNESSDEDEMSLLSSVVGAGGVALKSLLNQVTQSSDDQQYRFNSHSHPLSSGRKSLNGLIQQVLDQSSYTRSQKKETPTNMEKSREKPASRKRGRRENDEGKIGLTKLLNQNTTSDVYTDVIEKEKEDEKSNIDMYDDISENNIMSYQGKMTLEALLSTVQKANGLTQDDDDDDSSSMFTK